MNRSGCECVFIYNIPVTFQWSSKQICVDFTMSFVLRAHTDQGFIGHVYCGRRGKSVRSWCEGSSDRSFMADSLSYFSFQPVFHDWRTKDRDMYYPVCGLVHIKELLLLIGKRRPCGGSGFSLSLSEWSFTICLTPYNSK